MNHSCENTSLQNVSVENLQFPYKGWKNVIFRIHSITSVSINFNPCCYQHGRRYQSYNLPFSLQDLPNNMIHQVAIKSLPQEWLYCDTWCSPDTLKYAKTIDLVSNSPNMPTLHINEISEKAKTMHLICLFSRI